LLELLALLYLASIEFNSFLSQSLLVIVAQETAFKRRGEWITIGEDIKRLVSGPPKAATKPNR
jgi:hypothetical protein